MDFIHVGNIDEMKFDPSVFGAQPNEPSGPSQRDIWSRDLPTHLSLWDMLDPTRLLKPPGMRVVSPNEQGQQLINSRRADRSWFFDSGATSKAKAEKAGRTAQRNLVGRRKLTASDPLLSDFTLYVGWSGGVVKLDPLPKATRARTGPTQSRLKVKFEHQLEDAIGHLLKRVVKVKGNAKRGFEVALTFKDSRFGTQTMRLRNLEDGPAQITDLVGKLKKHGLDV